MKIAMWSGPRNLSTAMLYSFGNRPDCAVWDEPFYAPYLAETGIDHPMRDTVLAAHDRNATAVARRIAGPVPDGADHWYMKHMTFHMVEGFPLDWAQDCVNIHLIRHPARVIASYAEKRAEMTMDDIGFRQQVALFERLPGPVLDSADIRQDPRGVLQRLCAQIGLPWSEAMLSWPAGPKPWDGAWAPHWYNAVHKSTGFAGAEGPLPQIDSPLLAEAMDHYTYLKVQKG